MFKLSALKQGTEVLGRIRANNKNYITSILKAVLGADYQLV